MGQSSGFALLLLNVLPVTVVSTLGFMNEVGEGHGRVSAGPEVLNVVREAVVVETVQDVVGPSEFVCRLPE